MADRAERCSEGEPEAFDAHARARGDSYDSGRREQLSLARVEGVESGSETVERPEPVGEASMTDVSRSRARPWFRYGELPRTPERSYSSRWVWGAKVIHVEVLQGAMPALPPYAIGTFNSKGQPVSPRV